MKLDPSRPLREFVMAMPASTGLFETMGIDTCCERNKSLSEICRVLGLSVEDVVRSLENADGAPLQNDPRSEWMQAPLSDLMNHIVKRHHGFCRQQLARLKSLLEETAPSCGDRHRELWKIQALFKKLTFELDLHLIKEEETLFPMIARMEEAAAGRTSPPKFTFGTIQSPISMMILEHDETGDELTQIRDATHRYQSPDDGIAQLSALYRALKEFEEDMHRHVALEDYILFPRVLKIEKGLRLSPPLNSGLPRK